MTRAGPTALALVGLLVLSAVGAGATVGTGTAVSTGAGVWGGGEGEATWRATTGGSDASAPDAAPVESAAQVAADAPVNVTVTQRFDLTPARRGEVRITRVVELPDAVGSFRTRLPEDAAVVERSGFSRADDGTFEWDGERQRASLTYTLAVNETIDATGPEAADGRYLFADAGPWALFQRPQIQAGWSWRGGGRVGLTRAVETVREGIASDGLVYLGAHDVRSRTAHGQTFRLVVPDRATLVESPGRILDSLTAASDQLRVGDRDENVLVIAAPTTAVEWGVRGLQYGDGGMWVRDSEPLDTPENTWIHEYVHSRQDYEAAADAQWTVEAMATYYAALLALEQDRTDFAAVRTALERGRQPPQSEAVLADPSSWANAANYWKGMLVAGDIDRRIRLASDGTWSLQRVFSELNARGEPVDGAAFLSAVERAGSPAVRDAAERFATTSATPEVWSASGHDRAFGTDPARLSYLLGDDFAVSGPYRNGSLGDGPLTVYPGETLRGTGTVTNAGGQSAPYEVFVSLGDRRIGNANGTVAPGESHTVDIEHTAASTGSRNLTFGADSVRVDVRDPAEAAVTDLSANRTRLPGAGAVELTATVENDHAVPADRTVTIRRDGTPVTNRSVTLGAGESTVVDVTVRLRETGEYTFEAGSADPVTVTVADGGASGGENGTGTVGPGFGPVVALVALLAATLYAGRRGRQ